MVSVSDLKAQQLFVDAAVAPMIQAVGKLITSIISTKESVETVYTVIVQ